jgi:hypothetical protein
MLTPALPPPGNPLATLAATLFPFDTAARTLLVEAFDQTIEGKVATILAAQAESQKRERRVTAEVGALEVMGITKEHLLRLARRKEIKREQIPGTRRLYFRVGDLMDWCRDNIREDGRLKYATRKSATATKQKER